MIQLAEPSAVSEGYRRLPSELAGLTRRLGNAPVIVGLDANRPGFVVEGRVTELTVTLEVAPAAGESFQFRYGVIGPSIALGVPAVSILNEPEDIVDCRADGISLSCESLFFAIDDTATPEVGFVITLSTALDAVDNDRGEIELRLRPQDTNPHFVTLGVGFGIENVPRIQFSADAASAAWGDSHFTLTLDLDTTAGEASITAGILTFRKPRGGYLHRLWNRRRRRHL